MAPVTVLQIVPGLQTGGAELATLEIAAALRTAGARALVLSEGGRLAAQLERDGGELIAFPAASKNPWRMGLNASAIAHIARAENVSLIHARSRAPAWSALGAARAAKLPFVTTYHGAYGNRGPLKSLYNSVMARGDRVIANSRYTAGLIAARHGPAPDRLRVIHRGVDLAAFDPDAIAADRLARLRESWGIGAETPVILHPARLTGWKGQAHVIDAAAQLAQAGGLGDAVVIMAGDAQGRHGYRAGLEARIARHGLGASVRLVGHCDDIAAAYRVARVTVVASTEPEAFGRAAAEAQALGCPVVVTAIGATSETVLAEPETPAGLITGWRVPPADAGALAGALRAGLGLSAGDRAAMAARARAHVSANFSRAAMQAATLAVYDELLGTALAAAFKTGSKSAGANGAENDRTP